MSLSHHIESSVKSDAVVSNKVGVGVYTKSREQTRTDIIIDYFVATHNIYFI